jgi:mobilization protein NikA
MGRPRSDREKIRSVIFLMRLTKDERQRIAKVAETCGITHGEVVRQKLFKGKFPEPKIARIELNTYLELKKIGINLNQLTNLANVGRVGMDMLVILMRLLKQQEIIINQILHRDRKPENR